MRYQGDQNMTSEPRIQTEPAGQKEGHNKPDAPFMKTPMSSAPPLISSSFSLSALCHRCHSFPTPVCPSLLSHCPISLSVGWDCLFLEVCLWGEGIPRCSRPPLVFQLITQNMTALLLFGAEMRSCFSHPHGESKFSASLSPS